MTVDNADFTANLPVDDARRNYATPIPQLNTAVNAVFNEYFLYKQQSGSLRFFDVDFQKYLAANAMEINDVSDPQLREQMRELLRQHGYQSSSSWFSRTRSALRQLRTNASHDAASVFAGLDEAIDYARNATSGIPQDPALVRELLQARGLPTRRG
jgi:hypothetical protein